MSLVRRVAPTPQCSHCEKNELILESSIPPFTRILQGRRVLDNQPRGHFRQRFPVPNPPHDRVPEARLPLQDACVADLCPASERRFAVRKHHWGNRAQSLGRDGYERQGDQEHCQDGQAVSEPETDAAGYGTRGHGTESQRRFSGNSKGNIQYSLVGAVDATALSYLDLFSSGTSHFIGRQSTL